MKKTVIIYGAMIAANIAVALIYPELVQFSVESALPLASILGPHLFNLKMMIRRGRWGKLYRESVRFESYARFSKRRNADGEIERGFVYDEPEEAEAEKEAPPEEPAFEVIYHIYNLSAIPFILFFPPIVKLVFFFLHSFAYCVALGITSALSMVKENRRRREEEARAIEEQRRREEQGIWK